MALLACSLCHGTKFVPGPRSWLFIRRRIECLVCEGEGEYPEADDGAPTCDPDPFLGNEVEIPTIHLAQSRFVTENDFLVGPEAIQAAQELIRRCQREGMETIASLPSLALAA